MSGTVPALSIVFMMISGLVSVCFPIALAVYFRRKMGADILPFFVGCGVMLVFAFLLEGFVSRTVAASPAGTGIRNSIWLAGLYGGFMAGLFEEAGRFIAFRTVLKKRRDRNADALMYGAGHGGFEAAAVLGITSVNNVVWSFLINSGNRAALTEPAAGELRVQIEEKITALIRTPSWQFLLGGGERILAILLHLALSVLVWFAAKDSSLGRLFPIAFLIHFAVDALAGIAGGLGADPLLIEAGVLVMTVPVCLYAKKIWDAHASGP